MQWRETCSIRRRCALGLSLALAQCFSASANTTIFATDYSIASIEYKPSALDKIGALRAGLICLPKGKLRWRDVARPTDGDITRALSVAAAAKGLPVAMPPNPLFSDAPPATTYRIKVVFEEVELRLCVAGSSLMKQTPSGRGRALIRWETYDRIKRTMVATNVFDVPLLIDGRDPRGSATVLADAMRESATRYAASRLGL